MLARIFTRLFYAAVFFALGVWAAPSMGRLSDLIDSGIAVGSSGFDRLWSWAESTVTCAPPAGRSVLVPPPPVAAAPTPAPAPAPAAPPKAPAATSASPAAPAPVVTTADLLDKARGAHARGDVSGAIRLYEDLIARKPDDAALRGELGNVYWSAGRLQDAARAFHGAAVVLIAAGRIDDADNLESAVRKGDAALADDLDRRIADARAK
jgi:hypothetical protein